jgi:hypothetical protein
MWSAAISEKNILVSALKSRYKIKNGVFHSDNQGYQGSSPNKNAAFRALFP